MKSDASRAATTTAIAFQDSSGNNMFSQLHNGQTIFSTGAVGSKTEAMRINSAGLRNLMLQESQVCNNIGSHILSCFKMPTVDVMITSATFMAKAWFRKLAAIDV